jgi:Phage integrase family
VLWIVSGNLTTRVNRSIAIAYNGQAGLCPGQGADLFVMRYFLGRILHLNSQRGRRVSLDANLYNRQLAPACDRIKLPRVSWHSFRHTHATLLHETCESLKTAQALLGHSDLETTLAVYSHVVPDSQRRAVERAARVLDLNGRRSVSSQTVVGSQTSGTKSLIGEFGEPGRTRTSNPLIKRPFGANWDRVLRPAIVLPTDRTFSGVSPKDFSAT